MRTEIIKNYYCEICGQKFDNSSECANHEHLEELLNNCRFWDAARRELFTSGDPITFECDSGEVYYIYIPDKPGCYTAVREWMEFNCANELPKDPNGSDYGMYIWRDSESDWINLREVVSWVATTNDMLKRK